MCDKSLVTEPCGSVTSCGISDCFPSLSPSQRQVTHALLTRPPLKYKPSVRKLPPCISVRLECVMHAASVHPEPGSNSRKMVYLFPYSSLHGLISFPSFCSLLFLYSCFVFLLWNCRDSFLHILLFYASYFFSCCSIFNDRSAPALCESFVILPHLLLFVNPFFEIF